MANIKSLYEKYGMATRALDFGKKEFKVPSKVNRKVEILVGWMLANGAKGTNIPLEKFLGKCAKRWDGKGTFTTADMFSPSDVAQALRLFYARSALGEYTTDKGPVMAEVYENKGTRTLTLGFRQFVPDLMEIIPADEPKPKTSKMADSQIADLLEEADLPEPEVTEVDKTIATLRGLASASQNAEIRIILLRALSDLAKLADAEKDEEEEIA